LPDLVVTDLVDADGAAIAGTATRLRAATDANSAFMVLLL
jgi:hypothetical protein